MAVAGLKVSIDGDASGLIGAINGAKDAVLGIPKEYVSVLNAVDNISGAARAAAAAIAAIPSSKTVSINMVNSGAVPKMARGTRDFVGGLALVNDQTGISDPRELIIDRGKAFIPSGRNVLLPLSKGAQVYTAAQTKAIMSGLGIPSYARGKANGFSEPQYYNPIDAVIGRIQSAAMLSATNAELLSSTKQLAERERDYGAVLENTNAMIDEKNARIERLNAANAELLNNAQYLMNTSGYAGIASWFSADGSATEDYYNFLNALSSGEAQEQAKGYFEDISKYLKQIHQNNADMVKLEQESALLGLDRNSAVFDKWQRDFDAWVKKRNAYNDWEYFGDSAEQAYERAIARQKEFYEAGIISAQVYMDNVDELSLKLHDIHQNSNAAKVSAWKRDFDAWHKMRSTYDDWGDFGDSESQFYARAIKRQEEFFTAGVIGWKEYYDNVLDYSLDMYKAASSEYDALLAKQRDNINAVKTEYSDKIAALRSSWDVADRQADLNEVNRLLGYYENAVTDTGRERYRSLLDQKKQLERDEQIYRLETEQNNVLKQLQAEYDGIEAAKKKVLERLRVNGADIAISSADISDTTDEVRQIAAATAVEYSSVSSAALDTLGSIFEVLQGIRNALGSGQRNTYNDSRTINVRGGLGENSIRAIVNGTVLSGLADFIY